MIQSPIDKEIVYNPKIGDKLYPVDNSWCYNIGNRENALLAATKGSEPELVEIITDRFKLGSYWFRLVSHQGNIYVCIDRFSSTKYTW